MFAYIVFDSPEPDAAILGVASSLEAAMDVAEQRLYNLSLFTYVADPKLVVRTHGDDWQYEVEVAAGDVRCFRIQSFRVEG